MNQVKKNMVLSLVLNSDHVIFLGLLISSIEMIYTQDATAKL